MNWKKLKPAAYSLNMIKLMRPKHYLKNALVFVSITFSQRLFDPSTFIQVFGGFSAFSLLSSSVYILNDIRDVEADRQHAVKKNRPIASGVISIPAACTAATLLIVASIIIYVLLCGFKWKSFALMACYFLVNLGYSLGLKHIPFVDIFLLVLGFLLRVLYGAAIIGEGVSNWVLLTVISMSFYLGLGKRRNELKKSVETGTTTRNVLKFYSFNFLDKFMYLCLSLAIIFYALWSADDMIIEKYNSEKLVWTVPFVLLLVMKYSADVESDSYGDPVDVITSDKSLIILGAIYILILLALIYVPKL